MHLFTKISFGGVMWHRYPRDLGHWIIYRLPLMDAHEHFFVSRRPIMSRPTGLSRFVRHPVPSNTVDIFVNCCVDRFLTIMCYNCFIFMILRKHGISDNVPSSRASLSLHEKAAHTSPWCTTYVLSYDTYFIWYMSWLHGAIRYFCSCDLNLRYASQIETASNKTVRSPIIFELNLPSK